MSPGRPWRREKSPKENPMDGLEQSSPALPEELDALRARVAMLEQGEALQEILRTAALSRDVGVALVQDMPLQHSLQKPCGNTSSGERIGCLRIAHDQLLLLNR